MAIHTLYSQRKRDAQNKAEVYEYKLTKKLLRQIILIWRDAWELIVDTDSYPDELWESVQKCIAQEHGVIDSFHANMTGCEKYLLENPSVEEKLDMIEASFDHIDRVVRPKHPKDADEIIDELNIRFRRANAGYQFENGMIFRMDSYLIHKKIVKPTLQFLCGPEFQGPNKEYLKAHEHYRTGNLKETIVSANNAFESVMKTICDQRHWPYLEGASASDLLKVLRGNGFLPDYLDSSFDQLAATLKSGLPKIRNKEGAHGQGSKPRETPDYVAAYALHLAATKILFLAEAHKALK